MIAELQIQTEFNGIATVLKQSYFTQPLKLANITEDKKKADLHLMLMSSSPGILDGDEYDIKIHVEANAVLHLHTQSYQRLYNMKNSASQNVEITVGENAVFYFLPHPVVPHQSSSFTALNNIFLKKTSVLLWGEIITCGRKGSGESFLFSKLQNCTKIFIDDMLCIQENILIEPLKIDPQSIGQLEGFTHQATLIFINEEMENTLLIKELINFLAQEKDIEFGISNAPNNGLILRLLGFKAEQLFEILKTISRNILIKDTASFA
jgi:urease accessory protein